MLTKRTLERWRKDALQLQHSYKDSHLPEGTIIAELSKQILRLTIELLDLQLLRKE